MNRRRCCCAGDIPCNQPNSLLAQATISGAGEYDSEGNCFIYAGLDVHTLDWSVLNGTWVNNGIGFPLVSGSQGYWNLVSGGTVSSLPTIDGVMDEFARMQFLQPCSTEDPTKFRVQCSTTLYYGSDFHTGSQWRAYVGPSFTAEISSSETANGGTVGTVAIECVGASNQSIGQVSGSFTFGLSMV